MWRLIVKLDSSKQFLGSLAIKHQVSLTGYPLSYYKDKKHLYLTSAGFMFGDAKNKKALIRDLKKAKELVNLEVEGDFSISVTKQPLFTEPVYSPHIIRPNPVVVNKEGYHTWDLASFNRKLLEKTLQFAEKKLGAKIVSFRNEKIKNISFTQLLPELTERQKDAMALAIKNGYYECPKKVNLESLAKKTGLSYSTFQAHLKKAEGKLIPEIVKKL